VEAPRPEGRGDALDEQVAAWCARGEIGHAASAILHELGPGLCGYLTAVLRNDDDAHDVLAEVAVHLLTALPRFRGDRPGKTWN